MSCNNCVHWIGEPINHCELGPNQYPLCQAEDVSPRPPGAGWVWIEEFGGGEWVQYPVAPAPQTPRDVLRSVLYGPAHQGPEGTRSTTGVWIHYPG